MTQQRDEYETMSLAEALPLEMDRAREILESYKALGDVGILGAWMIQRALSRAENATLNGDTVAMLRAYYDLKEIKE